MSWWKELVTDNPMLIEIRRFMRRFMGSNAATNLIAISITLMLLTVINMLVYINEFHYIGTAVVLLLTVSLLVPIMLHGSIAGERERRTWDMLLVAPVTNSQIIAGKFIGASAGIAAVLVAFAFPLFLSDYPENDKLFTGTVVLIMIAGYAYAVAAFTLFVSTRSKRSMSALGITYGCLFLGLAVFPTIASFATISNPRDIDTVLYLHPFYAVVSVNQLNFADYDPMSMSAAEPAKRSFLSFGLPHILIYFATAFVLLGFSTNALNSAGWEDPTLKRKT